MRRRYTSMHDSCTRCVGDTCPQLFTSAKGPTGTFSSPGYPAPYSPHVHCKYVFSGTKDERIRIEFQVFDLELGTSAGLAETTDTNTHQCTTHHAPPTLQHYVTFIFCVRTGKRMFDCTHLTWAYIHTCKLNKFVCA
jgi:CUB domain